MTKALLIKEAFDELYIKMHWRLVCGEMSVLAET